MNPFALGLLCLLIFQVVGAANIRHSIVKRKAEDGKLYVFSNIQGCVTVVSNEICPVNWTLNSFFAKQYEHASKAILSSLNIIEMAGANQACLKDMKGALCSQITPRCFEDGNDDYGDSRTSCEKIYTSCPSSLVNIYKRQNFCGKYTTGKHPKGKCVLPPSPIKGACGQPKYKMLEISLKAYERVAKGLEQSFKLMANARYTNGFPVFSGECLSKIKELSCDPLYCSADEKKLLVEHDEEDCNNMLNECFEKLLSSIPSALASMVKQVKDFLKETCKKLPDRNAQTESAPLTNPSHQQEEQVTSNQGFFA